MRCADSVRILPGVIDLPGVRVGIATDRENSTGVTAIVLPPDAAGAVSVLGGAPATRETDALRPENLVPGPDAILLTGGSAFGLRAADGAMTALSEAGRGVDVAGVRVPIIPAAAIFDLQFGRPVAPTPEHGREAVLRALEGAPQALEGSVGAGTGATVGKVLGAAAAMKSGQGAVTLVTRDGLRVGAIVAVNAVGSVVSETGQVIAGPNPDGRGPRDAAAIIAGGRDADVTVGEATTIAVVVVGARLGKAHLLRIAEMAHGGIARAIRPSHTLFDGDTVFAAAVGDAPVDPTRAGTLAALALEIAIRRAVVGA